MRRAALGGAGYFNAEARALFVRMTTQPTAARKKAINKVIAGLKTAGLWAKMDAVYVLAAHDEQAALLNWKGATYDLTKIGSPAFVADEGFTGSLVGSPNATDYLDTGFTPSTAAGQFDLNSAALSGWSRSASINAGTMMGATSPQSTLAPRSSGSIRGVLNQTGGTAIDVANDDGSGLYTLSRTSSILTTVYKNGVAVGTTTSAPASLTGVQMRILGIGQGGAVTGNWAGQCAFAAIGAGLDDTEGADLYDIVGGYMTTVGAA